MQNMLYSSDNPPPYRILPNYQAESYARQHGFQNQMNTSSLQIKSGFGRVFILDNGEVVLTGVGQHADYPSFVFASQKYFDDFREKDFFPIPRRDMTWMEANASVAYNFLNAPEGYAHFLQDALNVKVPFYNSADCEAAYNSIQHFLRRKKNISSSEQMDITGYFGLSMAQYLVHIKGYRYQLRKKYSVYNPYYEVMVLGDERVYSSYTNVLAVSTVSRIQKYTFREYYWTIAHVPVQDQLD